MSSKLFVENIGTRGLWSVSMMTSNPVMRSRNFSQLQTTASPSFKVGTGADVTVIPETVYLQQFEQVSLTEPTKRLRGPGQDRLRVVGVLRGDITYKTNKVATDVYVLKNLESPLLSRRDSEKLGVIKRLNEVSA